MWDRAWGGSSCGRVAVSGEMVYRCVMGEVGVDAWLSDECMYRRSGWSGCV